MGRRDGRSRVGWNRRAGRWRRRSGSCANISRAGAVNSILPLAPRGTEFQRTVWQRLQEIPYGETISYGELAKRVGNAEGVAGRGRGKRSESDSDRDSLPSGDWIEREAHGIRRRAADQGGIARAGGSAVDAGGGIVVRRGSARCAARPVWAQLYESIEIHRFLWSRLLTHTERWKIIQRSGLRSMRGRRSWIL